MLVLPLLVINPFAAGNNYDDGNDPGSTDYAGTAVVRNNKAGSTYY